MPGGLEDQPDRLLDGHEEPGHVGVGHRHRPRRWRSARASTCSSEPRLPSTLPKRTASSDRGRPAWPLDAPARRAAWSPRAPRSGRRPCRSRSARTARPRTASAASTRFSVPSDVGLHALAGVPLEERQVLVGRRVEDDLRAGTRGRSGAIRARSRMSATTTVVGVEQRLCPSSSSCSRCRFDSSWSSITSVGGVEAADLAAQLAADRAARAGDQHPLAGDQRGRGPRLTTCISSRPMSGPTCEAAHVAAGDLPLRARPGTAAGAGRAPRRPARRARCVDAGAARRGGDRDHDHLGAASRSSTSLQVVNGAQHRRGPERCVRASAGRRRGSRPG